MKVLITGTSQGIGMAIAKHFLREGHEVIGIDRDWGFVVVFFFGVWFFKK